MRAARKAAGSRELNQPGRPRRRSLRRRTRRRRPQQGWACRRSVLLEALDCGVGKHPLCAVAPLAAVALGARARRRLAHAPEGRLQLVRVLRRRKGAQLHQALAAALAAAGDGRLGQVLGQEGGGAGVKLERERGGGRRQGSRVQSACSDQVRSDQIRQAGRQAAGAACRASARAHPPLGGWRASGRRAAAPRPAAAPAACAGGGGTAPTAGAA